MNEGEREGESPASLWGGRFASRVNPTIDDFTNSLPFDRRIVRHDLIGSLAHARMLMETGILRSDHAEAILRTLSEMLREVEDGRLPVDGPDEDIHAWIERTLGERMGGGAGRLHTARSRNDQTSAALRLWTREILARLVEAVLELAEIWIRGAETHLETFLPGYTHLQRGQPVSLAHHLLAHAWSLLADGDRFRRAHQVAGVSPLGAGALAGTSFPVDPPRAAELLGFPRAHPNSLLAVADRDWVAEAAFACALLQVHLSRWAEEVVLWTSAEFGFATLRDPAAQGSSLMPQKRNPEAAELIRGKAGRAIGRLTGLLATLKSLPLAYNSDLQEDKEALFDLTDTAEGSLRAAAVVARHLAYRPDRMRAALRGGFVTATDLADALVRAGVPFREAHWQAGRAVREAEARSVEVWELPADVLEACCPGLPPTGAEGLEPEAAARARRAEGGPAPEAVARQLAAARGKLEELRDWVRGLEPPPIYRAHCEGRLLEAEIP